MGVGEGNSMEAQGQQYSVGVMAWECGDVDRDEGARVVVRKWIMVTLEWGKEYFKH